MIAWRENERHDLSTTDKESTDATKALGEHRAILEAYRAGDVKAAMKAMRDHLRQVRVRAIAECD